MYIPFGRESFFERRQIRFHNGLQVNGGEHRSWQFFQSMKMEIFLLMHLTALFKDWNEEDDLVILKECLVHAR